MLSKEQERKILLEIGNRIRELREERNLTQFNLANDADLSKNQIGRVERGENKLSIIAIIKISMALNVDISEILNGFYI